MSDARPALVSVGVAVGAVWAIGDSVTRSEWGSVPGRWHGLALCLYLLGGGAVLGMLALALRVATRTRLLRWAFAGAFTVLVCVLVLVSRAGSLSVAGSARAALTSLAYAAVFVASAAVTMRWIASGGIRRRGMVAVALGVTLYVDLTVLVSLYEWAHRLLECGAAGLTAALARDGLSRRPRLRAALTFIGAVCALTGIAALPWREAFLDEASYLEQQPRYLGRAVMRVESLFTKRPIATRDSSAAAPSSSADVEEDIPQVDPKWRDPPPESAAAWAASHRVRRDRRFNVIVYYVDSLRADVAFDPKVMPNVAAFADANISFRRAYATGSDTVNSLPALLHGRVNAPFHDQDLLSVADRAHVRRRLVIAQSASRFLLNQLPGFAWPERIEVPDHAPDRKVWGYGADQSTAGQIVDAGLTFIEQAEGEPYLLWLFNFDVHAWRELTKEFLDERATALRVPKQGALDWRYRVSARSVDEQFARLMQELKASGALQNTAVVFVADHGEAVGENGFWMHSTHLWESLVRVPLIMRVPGVGKARIDKPVSGVDVGVTLARCFDPAADLMDFHGDDLMSFVGDPKLARRLPIVMMAQTKTTTTRIGLVEDRWRLVLPMESRRPTLFDATQPKSDERNLVSKHRSRAARMTSELLNSPVAIGKSLSK